MGLWDSIRSLLRGAPAPAPRANLQRTWNFTNETEWDDRPLDAASLAVFADWLEERGDARFELIRLANSPRDFEALVDANAETLFGRLAKLRLKAGTHRLDARHPQLELEWHDGVLRGAALRTEDPWEDAAYLLRQPIAKTVRRLAFGIHAPYDPLVEADAMAQLAAAGPRVDSLFFGDFIYPDECEMSWATLGDLSAVWTAFPRLRSLKLRGVLEDLGTVVAPELTHFTHETSGLTRDEVSQLAAAKWPKLQHLEVWFGDENYGANCAVDDLLPLLQRSLPSLVSLGLRNFNYTDALIERLATSPLLISVKRLDLSKGTLGDEGVESLLRHRARFAHLEELVLSENFISTERAPALAGICAKVDVSEQRGEEDDMRYVAVSE